MRKPAGYARRFARIPDVLLTLGQEPDGMPLDELARRTGIPVAELKEDLLAYYGADVGPGDLFGLSRPATISFLAADGSEDDPHLATVVRLDDLTPTAELGVEYIPPSQLAPLYTAATMLLEIEPDDEDLAAALGVIDELVTSSGGSERGAGTPTPGALVQQVRRAIDERRVLRIDYSRAWEPGAKEYVIHPYRLTHTQRGWEVDAGPSREGVDVRTYLLDRIRRVSSTEEVFAVPAGIDRTIDANRATHPVDVVLPVDRRWVADRLAERVEVQAQDRVEAGGDADVRARLHLLEPLTERTGLLLLLAPGAFVVGPDHRRLADAGREVARRLLDHHGLGEGG